MTFGKVQFNNIKKKINRCPTSKDILQYIFDENETKIKSISKMSEFQQLKKQHLIKYLDSFYRKYNDANQIYEICNHTDKIILDKELTSKVIDIIDINVINVKYLDIPTIPLKKDTSIFHGTPYKLPVESDHMPYNWVGNWFSTNKDESMSYIYGDINETRLYEYNVIKDINLILFDKENSCEYLFIHIAFMEILIDKKNDDILIKVKYAKGTYKGNYIEIDKYNYTTSKNILNTGKNNEYGLYDQLQTKISEDFWIPIKLASSGDGDKPLAGTICNIYNSNDPYSININGWQIIDLYHTMICNPTEVLVNISGEHNTPVKMLKNHPNYNIYYKKYQKYKAKYLKLNELLKKY